MPNIESTLANALTALIVPLTPLVVWGIRLGIKKLPRSMVPMIVPVVGVALDFFASWIAGTSPNPLLGAALGAIGTWLRDAISTPIKYGVSVNEAPKLLG